MQGARGGECGVCMCVRVCVCVQVCVCVVYMYVKGICVWLE